jgi:hypothetical protein
MNANLIEKICDGDLSQLKKIPKNTLTKNITNMLVKKMETNILEYKSKLLLVELIRDSEVHFLVFHINDQINSVENCMQYLKKIK